jgi:tetratricopeptide (TPR) repeat protein
MTASWLARWGVAAVLAAGGSGSSAAEAPPAADPSGPYKAVQHAFLREEFQAVVEGAQQFLRQHPEAPQAYRVWLWSGLSLDRVGRTADALGELRRLEAHLGPEQPLWAEVVFWQGDVSRRAGQLSEAKAVFQRLLERTPESLWAPHARQGLGLVYLQLESYERALRYFREVAAERGEGPMALEARLYEGLCQLKLRRFADAVEGLGPLVDRLGSEPVAAQAAVYLAESLAELQRYEEATQVYGHALRIGSASRWQALAQFGLGWVAYRAGRCADSVQAFERYLGQPDAEHQVEARYAQGVCLERLGREPEALVQLERAARAQPGHPLAREAQLAAAGLLQRQGRFAQAEALLHSLLVRGDRDWIARCHLRLGALFLDQGRAEQAREAFGRAKRADTPALRQSAMNGLGEVHVFYGDLPQARKQFQESVRVSPSSVAGAAAAHELGRLLLLEGKPGEAAGVFRELGAREEPEVAVLARLALALALIRHKDAESARAQLEVLRRQDPETRARAGYYLALLAMERQEEPVARRLAEETIAEAPRSEESASAWVMLADLKAARDSVGQARRWLAKMLGQRPELPRQHRGVLAKRLGDFARAEGAYAEAIAWYDQAESLLPRHAAEVTYRIASCYEEGGDLALAVERYLGIVPAPWRVRGILAAAKLLERQGRSRDAEALYKQLAGESVPEAKVVQERLAGWTLSETSN